VRATYITHVLIVRKTTKINVILCGVISLSLTFGKIPHNFVMFLRDFDLLYTFTRFKRSLINLEQKMSIFRIALIS
jgi:hypothetical protein